MVSPYIDVAFLVITLFAAVFAYFYFQHKSEPSGGIVKTGWSRDVPPPPSVAGEPLSTAQYFKTDPTARLAASLRTVICRRAMVNTATIEMSHAELYDAIKSMLGEVDAMFRKKNEQYGSTTA